MVAVKSKQIPSEVEPLRRAELVRLSAKLFARQGYTETTINDIVEGAALSKATFYHYFTSKQQVFEEIVLDALQRLNGTVLEAVAAHNTARGKLEAAVAAHADFFEENFWTFTSMMLGFGGLGKEARAQATTMRDVYADIYRAIIRQGVENGEFSDIDPNVATRGLLSMLFWMSRWFNPSGERRAKEFSLEYLNLMLFGLILRKP